MRIGVDIDSVVAKSVRPFLTYFNEEFGLDYQFEDLYSYYLTDTVQHPQGKCMNTAFIEYIEKFGSNFESTYS